MQTPQAHFQALEEILAKHSAAIEAEVRALQQADETTQWPTAWKQIYNWHFAQSFVRSKVFRNWAADAAAWKLLPPRSYPNQGNRQIDLSELDEDRG